ncbi:MAG: phosphodiester glycosidase family protein [Armatimonadetes bacterium]|nr:phosphodiester glycosidase family protein [Armatimonadota bacterium]
MDHIQTSRTSVAWSKDNRHFFLLTVKTPRLETAGFQALQRGSSLTSGWTLAGEQRFWRAKGVWGAVNIDGGDVTQMTLLRRDGRYDLVPPHWADSRQRLTISPSFAGAPAGGTMMYFYVRDADGSPPP